MAITVREGPSLRGLLTVYRRLSALVGTDGADLAAVVSLVHDELGAPAAVVDRDRTVLAVAGGGVPGARSAGPGEDPATSDPGTTWPRVLGAVAATGRTVRAPGPGLGGHVVAPVAVADAVSSFLVVADDPAARPRSAELDGDDVVLLVAEHAATVAAVLAGRARVLATAAGQVRGDLLSGLLLGRARHPGEAARWAEHVGYDAGVAHRVLLVVPREDGPGPGGPGLLAEAGEQLARIVPGVLQVVRDTEVAALLPDGPAPGGAVGAGTGTGGGARDDPGTDPVAVGARCARGLARGRVPDPDAVWPVTVALGRPATGPTELARSYDQARRTVEAARRLGREGRVLRFDDLGVHRLLLQVPDPEDARAFAREVLGRLATDGSERTVELLRTLARYFREDGSPQRTAKALSVHPNTVGYRLRRAEEMSGLSWETYRDRLAAQVALEILGWMDR